MADHIALEHLAEAGQVKQDLLIAQETKMQVMLGGVGVYILVAQAVALVQRQSVSLSSSPMPRYQVCSDTTVDP